MAVLIGLGATALFLEAQDDPAPTAWWRGDYATGTWGGLRDTLAERGVTLNLEYTADGFANLTGGQKTGAAYLGLAQVGLDWQPARLIPGWKGAQFRVSAICPHHTRHLTLDLVGDVNGADNLEAPDGARLYEVWYRQTWGRGRFTFQAGNLLADEDFAYTDLGGVFINAGFGWSQFVAANTGTVVPAYSFAAPGARFEVQPTRRTFFQAGIYDGDALDSRVRDPGKNRSGTRLSLSSHQGLFALAEVGLRLNQLEGDTGPPGAYKVGAFYHSATFDDLFYDGQGGSFIVSGLAPRKHSGNYLVYLAAEQTVWREPGDAGGGQGLGLFMRLGAGPANRNPFNLVIDAGIVYQGLLPGRNEDQFGLGVIYTRASNQLRRQQRDDRDGNGSDIPFLADHETAFEMTYRVKLNAWWHIQPDLQWIIHPGASAARGDAWVFGIRSSLAF